LLSSHEVVETLEREQKILAKIVCVAGKTTYVAAWMRKFFAIILEVDAKASLRTNTGRWGKSQPLGLVCVGASRFVWARRGLCRCFSFLEKIHVESCSFPSSPLLQQDAGVEKHPYTTARFGAVWRVLAFRRGLRRGLRCGEVRFGAVRCGSARFGAVRFVFYVKHSRIGAVRFGSARFGSARCGVARCGALRYGAVQRGAACYGTE
jgi:hypothetical protein